MKNIEKFIPSIPILIILLIGLTYILGFIRCQIPYINEFGFIPFKPEYYLFNGFTWLICFIILNLGILYPVLIFSRFRIKPSASGRLINNKNSLLFIICGILFYINNKYSGSENIYYVKYNLIFMLTSVAIIYLIFLAIICLKNHFNLLRTSQSIFILLFISVLYTITLTEIFISMANYKKETRTERIYNIYLDETKNVSNIQNTDQYMLKIDIVFINDDYLYCYNIINDKKVPSIINKKVINYIEKE